MCPLEIVAVDVAAAGLMQLDAIGEVRNIDQFVLDEPPEAFDEDVVDGPSAAVHTGLNGTALEDLEEVHGSELGSLVGVEDERLSPTKRIAASGCFQGVGERLTNAGGTQRSRRRSESRFHLSFDMIPSIRRRRAVSARPSKAA